MKTIRVSIAVLLSVWGLAGMGDAKADNGSVVGGVKITKADQKKVRVYTEPGVPVDVAIIDADGNVLYQGAIAKGKARSTSFDLNSLPDGQYTMTAGNSNWWMSQPINIQNNALVVNGTNAMQLVHPTVTAYEKGKVEVVMPATNVTDASVSIYDMQNVLVHNGTLQGSVGRFDLSALPSGAYTFVVGPNQKQFTTRVDVRN